MTQLSRSVADKQQTYLHIAFGSVCAFGLGVSQPRSGSPNLNPQEKHP